MKQTIKNQLIIMWLAFISGTSFAIAFFIVMALLLNIKCPN